MQAQAAAQLLHEDRHRLGGPQEQDQVDDRDIDAFIEKVDGEQHAQPPGSERRYGFRSVERPLTGVDRSRGDTRRIECRSHAVCVLDRHTEAQRRPRWMLAVTLDDQGDALRRDNARGQPQRVVSGACSVQQIVAVLDGVGDAEVVERHQPAEADRLQQTDLIGEVAVAQREQVAIVRAEGRGREPEEECRIQRRQDTAVTLCRRVMELIDHHVIEMAVAKSLKMRSVRHGLHRREHDVTIVLGLAIHDEATGAVWIHARIGLRRLLQQFTPVRDEQHLARVGRIECSEKGLAEPGGRDDQRPPFAIGP